MLWIADPAGGRLEYVSPAYERVWGDWPELIMGDLARWAALVHPDDRQRAFAAMPRLLAGETQTLEYRIVRPDDGAVRHIRDTGFPIRDGEGRLRRLGGIAQDVTEEHAREERWSGASPSARPSMTGSCATRGTCWRCAAATASSAR